MVSKADTLMATKKPTVTVKNRKTGKTDADATASLRLNNKMSKAMEKSADKLSPAKAKAREKIGSSAKAHKDLGVKFSKDALSRASRSGTKASNIKRAKKAKSKS